MPYLIDGHNLIEKTPGLSLSQLDDEKSLFKLLDVYFKHLRKKAIVFFDRGNFSSKVGYKTAFLEAHFVHLPRTADEEIIFRIKKLKGEAKNYTVVTSDHWIADNARSAGTTVISSTSFANKLINSSLNSKGVKNESKYDVDYWMNIFGNNS